MSALTNIRKSYILPIAMENFNFQLGRKLKEIREKFGMTLEEVANQLDFNNYQTVSSIENGSRAVKSDELAQFAKLYHYSLNSLLDLEQKEESISILWRQKTDVKGIRLKEQEFLKYCNNYFELEERLGINHKSPLKALDLVPDDFDFNRIEIEATKQSNEMDLGSRPACSLRKVLEEKYNIKILYIDLDNLGSAASAKGDFGLAILINSTEAIWRRNFDLAHELFHLLTWNVFKHEDIHCAQDEKSIVEKYADAFAASLLLPKDEILNEFGAKLNKNKISLIDLVGIGREFEVSTEALLWRLVSLRQLRREDVQKALNDNVFHSMDRVQRVEDHEACPYISEKYVNLALKAYKKDLISRGKLAEYLGVGISDVKKKLSEYGYNDGVSLDGELTTA